MSTYLTFGILAVIFVVYCWRFHEKSTLFWLGVAWFSCNFVAIGSNELMKLLIDIVTAASALSAQALDAIVTTCNLVNLVAKIATEFIVVGIIVAVARHRRKTDKQAQA